MHAGSSGRSSRAFISQIAHIQSPAIRTKFICVQGLLRFRHHTVQLSLLFFFTFCSCAGAIQFLVTYVFVHNLAVMVSYTTTIQSALCRTQTSSYKGTEQSLGTTDILQSSSRTMRTNETELGLPMGACHKESG